MEIVHLTSVHARYDTRIFLKQCHTIAEAGLKITLIVADGKGNEQKDGITILDVGFLQGRLKRILLTTQQIFAEAKKLNADLYHFHDPELIPVGLCLQRLGKKVVFDAHEDVPKQLLNKPYLNPVLRKFLSLAFSFFEQLSCRYLDAIVSATPTINDKFCEINHQTITIHNFPILGELSTKVDWYQKSNNVCYVGGITRNRGAVEMIKALEQTQTEATLILAGKLSDSSIFAMMQGLYGWHSVQYLGFLDRKDVRDVLAQAVVGLVLLHPIPNYVDALPIKMFEYMSAGIPVIASDFPLWRSIVEANDCGICVSPFDVKAIARAIDDIVANPKRAQQMGQNGQQMVQEAYNWSIEADKLLGLYKSLL